MAPQEMLLDQDWHYTQTPSRNFNSVKRDWQKCSSFPTSVHIELKKAGKINNPYEDLNEWDVQCEWGAWGSPRTCRLALRLTIQGYKKQSGSSVRPLTPRRCSSSKAMWTWYARDWTPTVMCTSYAPIIVSHYTHKLMRSQEWGVSRQYRQHVHPASHPRPPLPPTRLK